MNIIINKHSYNLLRDHVYPTASLLLPISVGKLGTNGARYSPYNLKMCLVPTDMDQFQFEISPKSDV